MVQRPDGNPTPSLLTQLAASPPSRPRARPPSVLLLHLPALFHLHLSSLLLVVYLLPRLLSPLSLSLSLILPISCYLRFFPLLSSPFLSPILHALTEEDPFFIHLTVSFYSLSQSSFFHQNYRPFVSIILPPHSSFLLDHRPSWSLSFTLFLRFFFLRH